MFSSDVVAFEAQTAPLWENSTKQNDQSPTKKRESNEQKNGTADRKRKLKPIPISRQLNEKRQKIMMEFTECRLCELKFDSELLLEEHLFSILHHRALHTEKGECQHVCNLCSVTCRNLASYVQHLQDEAHRKNSTNRKTDIAAGKYKTPKNRLRRYTSTFMCLPTKSKKLRNEKAIGGKIMHKQKDFRNSQSEEFEPSITPGKNQHFMHRLNIRNNEREGFLQRPPQYPDWGNRRPDKYYDNKPWRRYDNYYPQYDWTEDSYHGGFRNPYEEGWAGSFYQEPDRDSYHWNRPDYRYENGNNFYAEPQREYVPQSQERFMRDSNRKQAMPKKYSPIKKSGQKAHSFAESQARTKKLVAQAHKVINKGNSRNGQPNSLQQKGFPKTIKNRSLSSESTLLHLSCEESATNWDEIFSRNLTKKNFDGSLKQSKRKNDLVLPKRSNSLNSTRFKKQPLAGRSGSKLSDSTGTNVKNKSPGKIKKSRSTKRSISLESKIQPNIYNEFRKQIDKELSKGSSVLSGPKRVKSLELKTDLQKQKMKSAAPISDIRAKFRKILEDIDGPVASASEILHGIHQEQNMPDGCKDDEISIETSWTHSTGPLSSSCSNVPTSSIQNSSGENSRITLQTEHTFDSYAEPSSISNNLEENLESSTFTSNDIQASHCDSTQYNSLPTSTNSRQTDPLDSFSLSDVTLENSTTVSTPARDDDTNMGIGEIDTPTNKNRLQPQPNVNKARSRLTSKQKDSPDIPVDIRQAKLKKLFLKYDRTKKISPVTKENMGYNKKSTGPRFGIDLNLQSDGPLDSFDVESISEKIELVEILPEKRVRSLSESDGFSSFGMESSCNISSFNSPRQQRQTTEKLNTPTQPEIRTSTPTCSTPSQSSEGLNSKLLSMSEREETLHGSIRSLAIQEANAQAEIASKIEALRTLQTELEKLKERKLCIDALKRRNEEELEALRGERLMLLRDSVSNSSNTVPQSNSMFQNVPPNSRLMTPSFDETPPTNQNTVSTNDQNVADLFRPLATGNTGREAPSFVPSSSNQDKLSVGVPVQSHNVLCFEEPEQDKDDQTTRTNVVTVYPNFDISKVKTETNSDEDRNLPFAFEYKKQPQQCVKIKQEKDISTSGNNSDSTKFFSFAENDEMELLNKQMDIDNILSKYAENKGPKSLNKSSPGKKQKSPRMGTRRSPRHSGKEIHDTTPRKKQEENDSTTSPQKANTQDVPNTTYSNGNGTPSKSRKTHELPLVGMRVLENGLVTCSLDETIVYHKNGNISGEKIIEKLDATPTSMTAVSTITGIDYVFVSTQKIVSGRINSGNSEVINHVEYFVNIFAISDSKGHAYRKAPVFHLSSKIIMKTRVLCMHYDKHLLFCGMRDGMAAIISLNSSFKPEEDINILECHSCSAITCLTTGTEGPRHILCCGSTDCTVSVRDATDGLLLRTIQGHTKTITCVQILHNELFSASVDRRVLGHDLITGKLLHKFMGHVGVVRSFYVTKQQMVTLCSDRNIRFFDIKTCRLLQKPKLLKSLPLHVDVKSTQINNEVKHTVFIGCEDSIVVRVPFPTHPHQQLSEKNKQSNFLDDSGHPNALNKQLSEDIEFVGGMNDVVNLTGEFECRWSGCTEVGTFTSTQTLKKHLFDKHLNLDDLFANWLDGTDATLAIGTCCQWESCTHYFAPELDTITDMQTHVQKHLMETQGEQFQNM